MNEFSFIGYGVVLTNDFPFRSHQPPTLLHGIVWHVVRLNEYGFHTPSILHKHEYESVCMFKDFRKECERNYHRKLISALK